MKTLYWKTRPLRRTKSVGRFAHWPGVALNFTLACALVGLPFGGIVLADLDGNFAELFALRHEALPIALAWSVALFALGFGYRLTVPTDCLPGEQGEPPAQRITRWFHWANLRAVLFGGLAGATVLLVAATLSGWQGRRLWETYRAEAVQRGVVFDLEKLMPSAVPDTENFAATPLLRPFMGGTPEFEQRRKAEAAGQSVAPIHLNDPKSTTPTPSAGDWLRGQRHDLAAWQNYYRASTNFPKWPEPRTPAEDVLKALSRWDAEIAELRTAATRPSACFDIKLTEDGASTLLPHLAALRTIASVVSLRSLAELSAGRTDDAFADAKLAFRLGDTLKDEPILITHLVRIATHTIALRTVWEGLAEHRWSDAQLAHWQTELGRRSFATELRHAMAGERAFGNRIIEFLRRKPEMLPVLGAPEGAPMNAPEQTLRVVPSGWFYREQISYNRTFDDYVMSVLPAEPGLLNPKLMQARSDAMLMDIQRNKRPIKSILQHRVLSYLLLPALNKTMHRAFQAQVFTQLAVTACALERHRLARGSYPESLAALTAEFGPVPADSMTGQPFHYERTADGRFRLWSVGWNLKDDGGSVVLREPSKKEVDPEKGDWVWPVPERQR